jgi:hypothetical protein
MDKNAFFNMWNKSFGESATVFIRGMWLTRESAWAMYQIGMLTNREARQIYFGDLPQRAIESDLYESNTAA